MHSALNPSHFTKPFKWLLLAFLIKLFLYFIFINGDNNPRRLFSSCFILSPDHNEYLRPIDNFVDKGTYAMDGSTEPYAGRLPGFVFPYILFRALFSETTATVLLGIFILALSILASYTLSLLIYKLIRERWAFIAGFLLINFVPFFWHYDWTLHVNSLGVSCVIFFSWYFYKYLNDYSKKSLLLAGFFLAWLVLLRGFCLVFIPVLIFLLFYILYKEKQSLKKIIIACSIFILPFFVFEATWICRNFISLHKFIPLQTSFVPGSDSKNPEYATGTITKYSMMKVRQLIFAWGGDNTWYFKNADMAWFVQKDNAISRNFKFDEKIFFQGFTLDSLNSLKSSIIYSYAQNYPQKQQDSIEDVITHTAERYYNKFRENHKIYFYLYAPFKRLNNYLFKNISQDWPGQPFKESNLLQKTIKLISLSEYALLLLFALAFPIIYLKQKKHSSESAKLISVFYLLVLANVIPFATIIYMSHFSYFSFGYVLLIPLSIFVISVLKQKNN